MGRQEVGRFLGQRLFRRVFERPDLRLGPFAHVVVLHVPPDRLDLRQLRTIAGQVMERDPS